MPQNIRKFIGMLLIVTFVIVYTFIAMFIGSVKFHGSSMLVQLTYYLIAGLLWTVPVGLIIKWMQRPDTEADL